MQVSFKHFLQVAFFVLTLTSLRGAVSQYELYPNIHTIGVSIRFSNTPPQLTGEVYVSVKQGNGWSTPVEGFRLSKVTPTYYAGCVFNTLPGTWYRVQSVLRSGNTVVADITDSVRTMDEPAQYTALRRFYVSPNGSGISQNKSTPGALDQSLLNSLTAGDKVVLLPGKYFTGELNLKTSGTHVKPIVFEGEGEVWLDGGFPTLVNWSRVSSDSSHRDYKTFYTNLGALNTNCVIVDSKRLYPYRNFLELVLFSSIRLIDGSGNATGIHKIGLDGFWRDGRSSSTNHAPWTGYNSNTYLRFADGSDTAGKRIEVSRQSYCFEVSDAANIIFRKLNFRLYGAAKQNNHRCAILLSNADSLIIDSCNFEFCDRAIAHRGSSSHNIIQYCSIKDDFAKLGYFQFKETGLDYQHLNTFYPNFFPFQARNIEPGRVYFDHGYTGRGNIIWYNKISGGCDAITCPPSPGDSTTARHFDIYGNLFGEGSDDAFEVDGNAANIRIWNNHMHGAGNGISVASPCYGPVYIFRNVMHDFRKTLYQYVVNAVTMVTDTIPGSPLKLNAAYCDIPGEVFFLHNTVSSGPDAYGFLLQQPQSKSSWSKVVAWNNIIFCSSRYYTLWVRATDSIHLDYNVYYASNGFKARQDRPGYSEFNDLEAVKTGILGNINNPNSGIEQHSFYIDPRPSWVDEKWEDYRLGFGSELHNLGKRIPGINDDYFGSAPDPGAFEFTGSLHRNEIPAPLFRLYPNPASNSLVITPALNLPYEFSIVDMQGRTWLAGKCKGLCIVNIESLHSGIYGVQLRSSTDNGTQFFYKP